MLRRAAFASVLTAVIVTASFARADVPAPVGDPPPAGGSPGTGGLPPIPAPPGPNPGDPTPPQTGPGTGELPPIPSPSGDSCQPEYPGINNTPGDAWYDDMYENIYYTSYYFQEIAEWSYSNYQYTGDYDSWQMYVNAGYMQSYLTEYFWNGYTAPYQPRYYSFGGGHSRATRGDFNYGFHYYIQPVYHEFVRSAQRYYSRHQHSSSFDCHGYMSRMQQGIIGYHQLDLCNGGRMGTDPNASDDMDSFSAESAAGVSVSRDQVLTPQHPQRN